MIFGSVNLNSPAFSLYSIPLVWLTAFYPSVWKTLTIDFTTGYDNVQPRSNLLNTKLKSDVVKRLERMMAAHDNGNETMPFWFAAVIAGNFAGIEPRWLNMMSMYYLISRILFNQVYINHPAIWKGNLRSTLFFISMSFPLRILYSAAQQLANVA